MKVTLCTFSETGKIDNGKLYPLKVGKIKGKALMIEPDETPSEPLSKVKQIWDKSKPVK